MNEARAQLPTNQKIWITAAELEEAHGQNEEMVDKIIHMAVSTLTSHHVMEDREQWFKVRGAAFYFLWAFALYV